MTIPDYETLRTQCLALVSDTYTRRQMATESGIAYGTFTNWLNGTYAGRVDKVNEQVHQWIIARAERAAATAALPTAPAYVATPTADQITAMLTYAQSAPDIVVVAGGAGIGKTETAREYRRTRPNVFLATMRPTTSSVHTMLAEIAETLGIEERSAAKLPRAIGRKLSGSGSLLVIDEAQHLATNALDELRSLHDAWRVGVALLGNESVYSRLEGTGRSSSLAQLYSRVGMRMTRGKPLPEDVTALITAWGIDDAAAVSVLRQIAAKPGALRGLTKTLRLAALTGGLSSSHIRAAWSQLGNTPTVEA